MESGVWICGAAPYIIGCLYSVSLKETLETPIMSDMIQSDWQQVVTFLKAMSHPVRLRILQHLIEGARCVHDVQQIVSTSQPNLSQHLTILKKAGLVGCHSNGSLRCYYLLRPSLVNRLLKVLTAEHAAPPQDPEIVIHQGLHRTPG